ncbi:MAG: MFS transporter [Clostridium sp.]|nr:MFS transporter [Prevotella sp.]MCM1428253.1 MFS transporter [Clostridium sp.]MCM1474737.1 MFS transporter [Muribaculaceae bacterium]
MSKNNAVKGRLALMSFLEFAVWGSYLVSMSMFLRNHGLADQVFWFYTVQGLVSIFMPALIGIVADKWIPAQITLSLCHLIAGGFMIATGVFAALQTDGGGSLDFPLIFSLYTISVAFFMPTIGLCNSVSFSGLEQNGLDTVTDFPPIRTLGTVGFIFAENLVNFISIGGTPIQFSYTQFYVSGLFSIILALYALSLPACRIDRSSSKSIADALGLKAFKLFKKRDMAIFFIFSMLLGVSLQITNSYGSMFINHFASVPEFMNDWWVKNPTFLISISQCAEALCILAIPFCLKRFGIKGVMLMAMFAWVLRFGFFGLGNTGNGVSLLILSCIVYGVAFDFFNVSGGLYVDLKTDSAQRSSAQGLFMLMTNGIGASVGTFLAGTCVVNKLVLAPGLDATQQLMGWRISWGIFALYALIVAILFMIIFKEKKGDVAEAEKLHAEEIKNLEA